MAGPLFEHPYYPIIYVRGYAGTDSDIEDTVSDPYMGFNLGSTRTRTLWTGDIERYYFESPLVRLMKDFKYTDVYSAGLNNTEIDKAPPGSIDPLDHDLPLLRPGFLRVRERQSGSHGGFWPRP